MKVPPSPCTGGPGCSKSPNVMRSVSNIMKFYEPEIAARYSVKNLNATDLQPKINRIKNYISNVEELCVCFF